MGYLGLGRAKLDVAGMAWHATIDYSHRRPHAGGGRGQAVWQDHARKVGELPKIVRRGQGGRRASVWAHPNLLPLLKNEILIRNPNSHVRSRHVFPSPCSESPLHRASVPPACGPCPLQTWLLCSHFKLHPLQSTLSSGRPKPFYSLGLTCLSPALLLTWRRL